MSASAARRRAAERGATAVEYALTASVGALIAVGGMNLLGPVLTQVFDQGACDESSGYYCEETP